jgi:hypothetical protein
MISIVLGNASILKERSQILKFDGECIHNHFLTIYILFTHLIIASYFFMIIGILWIMRSGDNRSNIVHIK